MIKIKRGQLYYIKKGALINEAEAEEEIIGKPALILSANEDVFNLNGTFTVANITRRPRHNLFSHMPVELVGHGALAIIEQEVTITQDRLGEYIGELTKEEMLQLDNITCRLKGIDLENIFSEYEKKLQEKDEEIKQLKSELQNEMHNKKGNKGLLGRIK